METLRTSSYMIPVRLEKEAGKYMLIHGYTGAVDIVSEELLAKIKSVSSGNDFSESTLQTLLKRGYVTTKTQAEEYAYVARISQILHRRNKLMVKRDFTILVTYNCNFKCPYCFEKEIIKKQTDSNKQIVISKEMIDKIYIAMEMIEPNKKMRNNVIQLFGGEPLLKENREIIEYIIKKGKPLGFTFAATSNGYDLDHYEDLLQINYIQGVQITIDGTKPIHDTRRIHSVHIHSFDKIIDNIKKALNNGVAIRVRINTDGQNINEIPKLNDFFCKSGFYSYEKFSVYTEFISGDYNFNPSDYEFKRQNISRRDFLNILTQLDDKIEYDLQLYRNIYNAIYNKEGMTFSSVHCTAQSGSYIFDPLGNIYSCLEVVGNKDEAIGSYIREDIIWTEEKNKWLDRNIGSVKRCRICKYALLCGGGCFAKTKINSCHIESYCDDFPIRLKSIIQKIYSHFNNVN